MVVTLGLVGPESLAQEKAAPKAPPKIPMYGLEISTEEPVAAQLPNMMYEPGFGCTSDGSIGVNVALPPDKAKQGLVMVFYTISPDGKIVSFDFKKINDLVLRDGQRAMNHDVGERDVDFFFSAQPVKKTLDGQGQGKQDAPAGWFVARFDRDGAYHGAAELNLPGLNPQRMAVFDDGDLLVFALDEANRQPQLVRYSPTGQKVHYYFADAEFGRKGPAATQLPIAKGANLDKNRLELFQLKGSMQLSQMSHYKTRSCC